MKKRKILSFVLLFVLCTFSVIGSGCSSEETISGRIIKAINMTGSVQYERNEEVADVYLNMNFEAKDTVTTDAESDMVMQLDADRFVYMFSDTEINMDYSGDETDNLTTITLVSGEILNEINETLSENSQYEIKTSNAVIAIRGTEFYTKYDNDKTIIYCTEGIVNVKAANNELDINPGEAAVVENDTVTPATLTEIQSDIDLTVIDFTQYQTVNSGTTAQSNQAISTTGSQNTNQPVPNRNYVTYLQGLKEATDADYVISSTEQNDTGHSKVYYTSINGEEDYQIIVDRYYWMPMNMERYENGILTGTGQYDYDDEYRFVCYTARGVDSAVLFEVKALSYYEDGSIKEVQITDYHQLTDGEPTVYTDTYEQP